MIMTLVLVFFLGTEKQQVYVDEHPIGFAACAIRGQQLAAQWIEEHPKWALDKVRCTPGIVPRGDDI